MVLVATRDKVFVTHCIIPCFLFLGYSVTVGEFSGDVTEGTKRLEGELSHSLLWEIFLFPFGGGEIRSWDCICTNNLYCLLNEMPTKFVNEIFFKNIFRLSI